MVLGNFPLNLDNIYYGIRHKKKVHLEIDSPGTKKPKCGLEY